LKVNPFASPVNVSQFKNICGGKQDFAVYRANVNVMSLIWEQFYEKSS